MDHTSLQTKFGIIQVSKDVLEGDFESIPIIDLMPMNSSNIEDRKALASEIKAACTNVGFFYIKNHGVDPALVKMIHQTAKEYFALPLEEKMKSFRADPNIFRGYTPLFAEHDQTDHSTGTLSEGFNISYELDSDPLAKSTATPLHEISDMYGENVWPSEEVMPNFRSNYVQYYSALLTLGRSLLKIFALALNLEEIFFDNFVTRPGCMSRLIHYPPQPLPDEAIQGIPPHTDFECFTILSQDNVRALQVLNRRNQWIVAEPIPDHFVVNVGDFLQFWTNGVFRSTMHRATNLTGKDRYSVPFFFGVNFDAMISVLDQCISEENPAKEDIKPVMAGDYVRCQLAAIYDQPLEVPA